MDQGTPAIELLKFRTSLVPAKTRPCARNVLNLNFLITLIGSLSRTLEHGKPHFLKGTFVTLT